MSRKTVRLVAIIIIAAMLITSVSFVVMVPGLFGSGDQYAYGAETGSLQSTSDEELAEQMDILEKYIKFLRANYKDVVDYQLMIDGAFAGAADSLGDKYTEYFVTEKESTAFIESVSGEFSGIGVALESSDEGVRIVSAFLESPAAKAGIRAGDIVVKIDGVDVTDQNTEQVSLKLRGKIGTTVVVTVRRGGQEFSYTIIRKIIKTSSVSSEMLEGNIGYIKIGSFDKDTDLEFGLALRGLVIKGATSIILDVRDNGGGLISSAVGVANNFIDKGAILHFSQQGRIVETTAAAGTANYDLPMVLLVNENSASASEILAGALKDHEVATLVGTTTFGKGIAQVITGTGNGNQVKISSYYFTTPDIISIHGVGITPHVLVNNYEAKGKEVIDQYKTFAPMSEKTKPGPGAVGLNVFGAQQRLNLLGYEVEATGNMDAKTVVAVKKFQADAGLSPYGVFDYTTRDKLARRAYDYVYGTGEGDKQLDKAIEIIQQTNPKAF